MHCAERGEVLNRLRTFYGRSISVTAHQAEQSIRHQMVKEVGLRDEKIGRLEAEMAR